MIKTYKARVNQNSISYLLSGKQGNQVRYPFANGNVIINKYPSLTLRNRYCQELLESSLLFANNTIILDHEEEEYPGEKAKLEEEKNAALKSTVDEPVKKTTKKSQKEEVAGIRTAEEVINYINNRFDKDCRTLETAMKHADKAGLIFPDYGKQ
nr:MAG: hypothetical protein [Bacteriophage sp.]